MDRSKLRVKLAQALARRDEPTATMLVKSLIESNEYPPVKLMWHVGRQVEVTERFDTYAQARDRVEVLKKLYGAHLTYTL